MRHLLSMTGSNDGSLDNVIDYNAGYAMDGPEVTYQLVLTETRFLGLTLHYAGNPGPIFNQYLSFFVLDSACNQRDWEFAGFFAGETGSGQASGARKLAAGTYYIVVDGYWMPDRGDTFTLDVACVPPREAFLPVALRDT